MVAPASNNRLIAAMFGSGVVRGLRGVGLPSRDGNAERVGAAPDSTYPEPVDTLELSAAARELGEPRDTAIASSVPPTNRSPATGSGQAEVASSEQSPASGTELTAEEEAEVKELRERDQEVRRHEQAHKSAAGGYATGGPSYEYETGPDGRSYAVGGEVGIDTSEVSGDPQATILKMQQVQRAATAPANPSGQDRAVAAKAAAIERKARAELTEQHQTESSTGTAENAATGSYKLNPQQPPGALLDIAV